MTADELAEKILALPAIAEWIITTSGYEAAKRELALFLVSVAAEGVEIVERKP